MIAARLKTRLFEFFFPTCSFRLSDLFISTFQPVHFGFPTCFFRFSDLFFPVFRSVFSSFRPVFSGFPTCFFRFSDLFFPVFRTVFSCFPNCFFMFSELFFHVFWTVFYVFWTVFSCFLNCFFRFSDLWFLNSFANNTVAKARQAIRCSTILDVKHQAYGCVLLIFMATVDCAGSYNLSWRIFAICALLEKVYFFTIIIIFSMPIKVVS